MVLTQAFREFAQLKNEHYEMKKNSVKMARLVERDKADRSFDLDFWQKVGAKGRFEAAWQMVIEVQAFRGKNVDQSRLQRSVQSIKRRTS